MKVNALRLWSPDVPRAKQFYEETLGLTRLWDHGSAAGFDAGVTLIVEQDDPDEEPLAGRFAGVSLEVDDIERAYGDLRARGVEFLGPPEVMPWGGMLAHFKDPADNVLTLLGRNA